MHVDAAGPTDRTTTQSPDSVSLTDTDLKLRNVALSEFAATSMKVNQRLMLSLDDLQMRFAGLLAVGYIPLASPPDHS